MQRILLCTMLFLPASTASALPATSRDATKEVRALLQAQVAAWNRGDLAGFMEGYWNSPRLEFVSPSGVRRGWQTVLARYRQAYPDRQAMGTLAFSDLEVTVLCPGTALIVGRWQVQRTHDRLGGVFTLVARHFPEGWKIINDHTSVAAAP
jgi:uncharacterized protein (TIGR02246 family)